MKQTLDELAEALHAAQGQPVPRRVVGLLELRQQFGLPITPTRWAELGRRLPCALPPLERRPDGLWSFPRGWRTVGDLAAYISERSPGWLAPHRTSAAEWREAQVFAGVRACLVEALNVSPEEVVRGARLTADLGAE